MRDVMMQECLNGGVSKCSGLDMYVCVRVYVCVQVMVLRDQMKRIELQHTAEVIVFGRRPLSLSLNSPPYTLTAILITKQMREAYKIVVAASEEWRDSEHNSPQNAAPKETISQANSDQKRKSNPAHQAEWMVAGEKDFDEGGLGAMGGGRERRPTEKLNETRQGRDFFPLLFEYQ